jgi:hypothetical protein
MVMARGALSTWWWHAEHFQQGDGAQSTARMHSTALSPESQCKCMRPERERGAAAVPLRPCKCVDVHVPGKLCLCHASAWKCMCRGSSVSAMQVRGSACAGEALPLPCKCVEVHVPEIK